MSKVFAKDLKIKQLSLLANKVNATTLLYGRLDHHC